MPDLFGCTGAGGLVAMHSPDDHHNRPRFTTLYPMPWGLLSGSLQEPPAGRLSPEDATEQEKADNDRPKRYINLH